MKNKEYIRLLKDTRRKLTESKRAKKDWELQSKFVDLLLRKSSHRDNVKRDMEQMMHLGIGAEAALMYMMGVWMATQGYTKMIKEQTGKQDE